MASRSTEKDFELLETSLPYKIETTQRVEEIVVELGSNKLLENDQEGKLGVVAAVAVGSLETSEPKRLEGMALWLLTTGMMMAMFMMSLDKAIIGMMASLA
jgi:hypothetical protein